MALLGGFISRAREMIPAALERIVFRSLPIGEPFACRLVHTLKAEMLTLAYAPTLLEQMSPLCVFCWVWLFLIATAVVA